MLSSRLVPWEAIPKFKGPIELNTLFQHFDALEEYNLMTKAQGFEPVCLSISLSAAILRRMNMDFAQSNISKFKDSEDEEDNDKDEAETITTKSPFIVLIIKYFFSSPAFLFTF